MITQHVICIIVLTGNACKFFLLQHRTSTNLAIQPSHPATPDNDNDSGNHGVVTDLGSVKSKNGGREDGQEEQEVKPTVREIEESPKPPVHLSKKKEKKLSICKQK